MGYFYPVIMPYIGNIISDNNYKFQNRKTKPPVAMWMRELANKVEELNIPEFPFYRITISGNFPDERHPDISNLHKVIGDALKKVLPKDDKYYRYHDGKVTLGEWDPFLTIIIEGLEIDG